MYRPLHCVALRTIKYNDKHSILSAYSLELGRVLFLISAGSGREAVRRRALFMPLNFFECEADIRPGREMHTLRDVRVTMPLHGVHSHPLKNGIAMFVADILNSILRENQPDEATFAFLIDAIAHLDSANMGVANFHICFLYRLGRFIGIEPDASTYQAGSVFDMIDGRFRQSAPLHNNYLHPQDAKTVALLSRMTYNNMGYFKFSRSQRNEIVDAILQYYSIHYNSLSQLQSLEVLRCLF